MLIDLDPRCLVHHAGHFDGRLAVHIPGAERRAVAEVIEERSTTRRLLVPPAVGLLPLHLLRADLDLAGQVIERAAIAVVEMHLDQIADQALVDQPLGGHMAFDPPQRPVDRHLLARPFHRRDHRARIGGRGREGFFDKDVHPVRGEPLRHRRVIGGRRAEERHVVRPGGHAGVKIGEDGGLGDGMRLDGGLHLRPVRVVECSDLRLGVIGDHLQQIAHVHVIEADANDAEPGHESASYLVPVILT